MEYDNARVLITDQKLETIKEVLPLLEQLTRINQPLLIIAEDVTGAPGRSARLPVRMPAPQHTARSVPHVVYCLPIQARSVPRVVYCLPIQTGACSM